MPKVIIPDKICPHCGGNEWLVRNNKTKKGTPYKNYYCIILYREKQRKYYKTRRSDLCDSYIKDRICKDTGKKFNDVTEKEIIEKRNQIIEWRKWLEKPKKERQRIVSNRYRVKCVQDLRSAYTKQLIKQSFKYKGITIDVKNLSDMEIISQKAKTTAFRKYQKSDSYVKACIQSAITNDGGKVSFNDISKHKVEIYRKGLRRIRYYRELNKLLT